jgi:FtsP/CotA-like multicopper oxidase with cupredoxin domain/Cu/Ag efflux protein CusF
MLAAALILASLLACLLPAYADDPPDPDLAPRVSRYALTQAYWHGGDAERNALEAEMAPIPGADDAALELSTNLDGSRNVRIRLEIDEIQEEVYPGQFLTFWVFAPLGKAHGSAARLPSPTIRVAQGDHVALTLYNTHYLPHTLHLHGMSQTSDMDGVPDVSQKPVMPGEAFTYEFVARAAGTFWYHCHVDEDRHVPLGLAGMFIVEPKRPDDHFAHLIVGAGRIYSMARATREAFQGEYSLVYMDIDDRLNRIVGTSALPIDVAKRIASYDATQRVPDVFLLNGRAFPYTMRDTPIVVKSDQVTKLRVLNVGDHVVALHTHGHHPRLTDLDGIPVAPAAQVSRDTFSVGPGQRIDLALQTGNEGTGAAGPGVWMLHDHTQAAATNKGVWPGGNHTMIVYDEAMGAGGAAHMHDGRVWDPAYYRIPQPTFDPSLFHMTEEAYAERKSPDPVGGEFAFPHLRQDDKPEPRQDLIDAERHRPLAKSCGDHPASAQRVLVKAGRSYAGAGEVYGFDPRIIHAERCQVVEITLENTDQIRHDLMIPGLEPIFALNFVGPGSRTASFVTPDADVTLPFHCHVSAHEKAGMSGQLIVGAGGQIAQVDISTPPAVVSGTGTIIATLPRMSRVVVNHGEIRGFMGAMEMSYPVQPPSLLDGLNPGDKIEFVIDPKRAAIIGIEVKQHGP